MNDDWTLPPGWAAPPTPPPKLTPDEEAEQERIAAAKQRAEAWAAGVLAEQAAARHQVEQERAAVQEAARATQEESDRAAAWHAFRQAGGSEAEFTAQWPAIRARMLEDRALAGLGVASPRQAAISGEW